MKTTAGLLDIVAALISVAAGLYLLGHGGGGVTVAGETGQSWFEIIAHGMGAYFIARGIHIFSQSLRAVLQQEQLERIPGSGDAGND